MKLSKIISNTGEWLKGEGPHRNIVISSRVRLARNLRGKPFPGWAKKAERLGVVQIIKPVVESLPEMQDAFTEHLESLSSLEKQILVERHLISREHAARGVGSAVVMNTAQTLSFMINEEDHLRMQAICSGLQLTKVFDMINQADSKLEMALDFAFHDQLGYLTACPTNVGTGIRASAMLHLPALVMNDLVNKIINSVNKIGLAVRGLHGEGSEAIGNLFQVSNQTTLGESEEEIIDRLNKVIETILEHEQNARQVLLEQRSVTLLDQIGRAYGILCHARSIGSKEALNLLSIIKLGIDLGLFHDGARHLVDELFIETQPAHLQKGVQKMAVEARDALRSSIIRTKLNAISQPDVARISPMPGEDGKTS
ncbi:MAG: protein arginine kinase [Candidatus Xiphinematobacter sp.]|nr:MAG: protein arginine kinase [Candidatus Xiphinematobacter sp.]QQY08320.1 MAG: protein arginine kinase [Candidatus Xiphinematobacter sp.]QQY09060.1 MAG: protein arginine kinase [Candidatus Xiphinematobacter sp.]QQY10545.1 MAG: protein arginine kinase [Candidatus Xiphinematobacter sp.]QQY11281.1 MAG: protein arginine kinase [Candidatus Xiphinematobacter sp.]